MFLSTLATWCLSWEPNNGNKYKNMNVVPFFRPTVFTNPNGRAANDATCNTEMVS